MAPGGAGGVKPPDGPKDDQPKGFLKLPPEIRIKIYELVLLPPPVKRVECCGGPGTKPCSPGGRLLASTCKPTPSSIRTFNCPTCIWRGADIHTDILAVNRQISREAGSVLYQNTRLVFRDNQRDVASNTIYETVFSPLAFGNIKHFQLSMQTLPLYQQRYPENRDPWLRLSTHCATGLRTIFPNLAHATLHFDVDLTCCSRLEAQLFAPLADCGDVDYLVEVHITRALEGDDDFAEVIDSRPKDKKAAKWLDDRAEQLRADFVRDLGWVFEAQGKELKLRSE